MKIDPGKQLTIHAADMKLTIEHFSFADRDVMHIYAEGSERTVSRVAEGGDHEIKRDCHIILEQHKTAPVVGGG